MASLRFRQGVWQARISRRGFAPQVRSFASKLDAERWARSLEAAMDRGTFVDISEAERTTLGDLVDRYVREVTPTMRSAHDDLIRLKALRRHRICRLGMRALTPAVVAAFRDERLAVVQPATVIRELAYLSSMINHARREWGINVPNPVSLVRKPSPPRGRERTLRHPPTGSV
jgi:integrase